MLLSLIANGDGLTRKLNQAKVTNNVEEIRRVSANIEKGNQLFASWALRALGSTIEEQGDEILVELDAAQLLELESIRKQYITATECTVSVGIGKKVSDATRALLAAKLKGGNRSVFYDKDVEKEIQEAEASTKEERSKIVHQYLGKSQANNAGGEGAHLANKDATALNTAISPAAPLTQQDTDQALDNNAIPATGDVQGGPEALQPQVTPTPQMDLPQFEQKFREHADQHESAEKAKSLKESEGYNQIKKQVAEALLNIKSQMEVISALRTQAPDTYEAIMGVVRGLIMLGREITNTDDRIEKAELSKGIAAPMGNLRGVGTEDDMVSTTGIVGSDALDGGLGKGELDPTDFDQEQLAIGIQVEIQEHGLSVEEAKKLVMDHLNEDPDYYKKETLAKTEFFFDNGNEIKKLQYDGPANMAGNSQKHLFVNPVDKTNYVYRELESTQQALAAESASRLAEAILPIHSNYPVRAHNLVGHMGVMQPVVQGAHDLQNVTAQELTLKELNDLLGEFVVDFLIGNASTTGRDLLRTISGDVVGIDKKDSYKDFTNIGPYYQLLLESVKGGSLKVDMAALNGLFQIVQGISEDEYLDNVGEYAQSAMPPDGHIEFCKQLLDRKRNISSLFMDMFKNSLQKGERPEFGKMRAHIDLPVGSTVFGKIKVRHWDGNESWKSVKAGAIPGMDPGMAGEGHPVSAKNPAAK